MSRTATYVVMGYNLKDRYKTKLHDMNDANRKKLSDIETQLARYM